MITQSGGALRFLYFVSSLGERCVIDMNALCRRLTRPLTDCLMQLDEKSRIELEEIRIRVNRPVELVIGGRTLAMKQVVDSKGMDELLSAVCGYALYRCEEQMGKGYISTPEGHRIGICGRLVCRRDGQPAQMAEVTSVCIRIARQIEGAGRAVYPYLLDDHGCAQNVLLLGRPGCGKTTVLRDCALYLSDCAGFHVSIEDERGELLSAGLKGRRIDVLSGVDKAMGFGMLIRSMTPQVLMTDEIGREEDVQAVLDAARCGVRLIATAHADGFEDVLFRPVLRRLYDARAFGRYVLLGSRGVVCGVWNAEGERIGNERENVHGKW